MSLPIFIALQLILALTACAFAIVVGTFLTTPPSFRFSLRTFFVFVALIALPFAGWAWLRGFYYSQLHVVKAVLAEHPEIDKVWLYTNDDVTLEIEHVYFSLKDHPGVTFCVAKTDGMSNPEFREALDRALQEKQPVPVPQNLPEYKH